MTCADCLPQFDATHCYSNDEPQCEPACQMGPRPNFCRFKRWNRLELSFWPCATRHARAPLTWRDFMRARDTLAGVTRDAYDFVTVWP